MLSKDRNLRYNSVFEPLSEVTRGSAQACPECASQNPIGFNFCGQCGSLLHTKGSAAPSVSGAAASPETLTDEGFELTKAAEWDGAIKCYRAAIQMDRSYGRAFSNLGYALNRLGQYDEAIRVLTDGISVTKDKNILHRLHDSRGFAHSNLKKYSEAIDDFSRALQLNPQNPRVLYHRAESRALAGEINEAYDDALAALELDPDFMPAARLKNRLDEGRFGLGR